MGIRPAVVGIAGAALILVAVLSLWPGVHEKTASNLAPEELALLKGREIVVYKSPLCGCCHQYEEYLRQHGMRVVSVAVDDPTPYKPDGLAPHYWSCHTAVVDGYFVEGHVPVEAIVKLLQESPDIAGIALPGMPSGSPGMPGEKNGQWTIYALRNGQALPFMYY